jgi:transposase-like protein
MTAEREPWRCSTLRQPEYLNNIVGQDHRRVKRLVRPGIGSASFQTARRILAGDEMTAMMRMRQVRHIGRHDMLAQATLLAELFQAAA